MYFRAIVWAAVTGGLALSCAGQPKPQVVDAFSRVALGFEANQGPAHREVKFVAHGPGYGVLLTGDQAILQLGAAKPVRMKLAYGRSAPVVEAVDQLASRASYFLGNDSSKWRADVIQYGHVRYRGVYPGVDVVFYGTQGRLEYDLIVAPGADLSRVVWQFSGAGKLRLNANGDLLLETAAGELEQPRPVVYQEVAGEKKLLGCKYVLKGKSAVGFEVAPYDTSKTLVIDPSVSLIKYLGGNGIDIILAGAADSSGNVYVVGNTNSTNFPVTGGAQGALAGRQSAFVTKLSSTGNVVYSTYLGGNGSDSASAIAVDASGSAYVVGNTSSTNFPLVSPLVSTPSNGFVAKLNAAGSALSYSTYLGSFAYGVVVDSSGNAYVTGLAGSATTFPANALKQTIGTAASAYIAKINPSGSALVFYTVFGGSTSSSTPRGIALDAAGNIYVAGQTSATNFPTANPIQAANNSKQSFGNNAFVTEFNPTGSALVFSTYLGGSVGDAANGLVVSPDNGIVVVGQTSSPDFPIAHAAQPTFSGPVGNTGGFVTNGFVTKISPPSSSVETRVETGVSPVASAESGGVLAAAGQWIMNWSTFLSGSGNASPQDAAYSVAADTNSSIVVFGNTTESATFPSGTIYGPAATACPYNNGLMTGLSSMGVFLNSSIFCFPGPSHFFGGSLGFNGVAWGVGSTDCTGLPGCPTGNRGSAGVVVGVTGAATPPTPCSYSISPSGRTYGAAKVLDSFSVTTTGGPPSGCTWTPGSSASFIQVSTGSSGQVNSGSVQFSLDANTAANAVTRTGQISVNVTSGQGSAPLNFTVTQTACQYTWSPPSTLTIGPGPFSDPTFFLVSTQAQCPWSADATYPFLGTGSPNWLTLSPATGIGPGGVGIGFPANPNTVQRAASVYLTGNSGLTIDRKSVV